MSGRRQRSRRCAMKMLAPTLALGVREVGRHALNQGAHPIRDPSDGADETVRAPIAFVFSFVLNLPFAFQQAGAAAINAGRLQATRY